ILLQTICNISERVTRWLRVEGKRPKKARKETKVLGNKDGQQRADKRRVVEKHTNALSRLVQSSLNVKISSFAPAT
ncbi:1715_t:CDS:2, partial [Gigaspora rosea]